MATLSDANAAKGHEAIASGATQFSHEYMSHILREPIFHFSSLGTSSGSSTPPTERKYHARIVVKASANTYVATEPAQVTFHSRYADIAQFATAEVALSQNQVATVATFRAQYQRRGDIK